MAKIKIKDFNGKTEIKEVSVRNEMHFEVQQRTRSSVFQPKKGKGSFKRNKKFKTNCLQTEE